MTNSQSRLITAIILLTLLASCFNNSSTDNSSSETDYIISDNEKSIDDSTTSIYKMPERTISIAEKDPYEIMEVAFEGYPDISKIKPMLEAVLEKYDLPKTDEYRLKVGSMLVSLRKESVVGVTEMEILKRIYQHGSNQISLPVQAAISATILESKK
ncbi:MAG: hypothetical protein WBJ84_00595 [Bacteroidales bacterium]